MFAVREKYLWSQFFDEKSNGMGNLIPGTPVFVLPGASATFLAYMRDRHKYIYTDVNTAYAALTSGRGDCIVLAPGAHTLTAALAVTANNVKIYGPEAWFGLKTRKPSAVVTAFAANKGITVTGTDFQMVGVGCIPVTTKSFLDFSVAAVNLRIKDCYFDLATPAANTGTKGIVATGAATDSHISGCTFLSGGAQGPAIDTTALLEALIEENNFEVNAGTWANSILVGAATRLLIQKNLFGGVGVITAAIDGTGATVAKNARIYMNNFSVGCTVPIDNFSATNLTDLIWNWQAQIGGSAGGALVTANT